MSDGFDKEAEREKLREKFAEDEKKREHTQRMSELLLKGATMTNRHCEECGDPIFRHDGREFCPTCGNEVGGAGDETAGEAPVDEGEASADPEAEDGVDAAAENGPATGEAVGASGGDSGRGGSPGAESGADDPARSQRAPSAAAPSPESASPQESSPQRLGPQRSSPSRSSDAGEGVAAARASLTRTLTRFARAAEETDDPRRARDHLEAAREAAEALAALNR
ncbi:MAG: Sjogren's syndrome/scleroderma autoantigen 1 family protein [Methanobacteriota archaeon]